jgi:hypothetical protein
MQAAAMAATSNSTAVTELISQGGRQQLKKSKTVIGFKAFLLQSMRSVICRFCPKNCCNTLNQW